jgi:DNA topoisomerase I
LTHKKLVAFSTAYTVIDSLQFFWKKVMPRISAGRVQSVATKLIVEKERERMAFISSSWWDLNASCELGFTARLLSVEGKKVASTSDFGADGAVKEKSLENILLLDETGQHVH